MLRFLFTIAAAMGLALAAAGTSAQYPVTAAPASVRWPIFPPPLINPSHGEAVVTGGDCAGFHSHCECEVCYPRVKEVKEDKTCWNVKEEKVCIPAVTFPWEPGGAKLSLFPCSRGHQHVEMCHGSRRCCDACRKFPDCCTCAPMKCGTVRYVRVLEQEEYEVSRCTCEWEVRRLPACGPPDCRD
jgi:hypothetical protein